MSLTYICEAPVTLCVGIVLVYVLILYILIYFLWHDVCPPTTNVRVVTYLSWVGGNIGHIYFILPRIRVPYLNKVGKIVCKNVGPFKVMVWNWGK